MKEARDHGGDSERLEDAVPSASKMQSRALSPGVRPASRSWESKGTDFLLELPHITQQYSGLHLVCKTHFCTFGLQNYQIISLYCISH